MKRSPRLLAAVVFAVAAGLYMITLIARGGNIGNPPDGVPFLLTMTVLPAAVAGFFLGARLQRDAASVASTRTRALRGLFAGSILTALAYILGITGLGAVSFVMHSPYTSTALANMFEAVLEVLGDGIVEVLIGIPFGAPAGMAFYVLTGKRGDAV